MRRRADDADLAIGNGDGPHLRIALAEVTDAMGHAEHRDDRAIGKDRPRGHLGQTGRHPVAPRLEEAQACGKRHAFRQHQLDGIGAGIDTQHDAAGARALPHAQRNLALGEGEYGRRRGAARTGREHTAS